MALSFYDLIIFAFFQNQYFPKRHNTCNLKTDSTPSMISYYSVLYQNNRNISLTAIRSSGTLCIIKELYLFIYQLEWIFGVGVLQCYWGLGFLLVAKQEDLGQDGGDCDHTHSYQYRQTL